MHEIVTIQLGQQANYVGSHFWNAQESYFTYAGEEESLVDHDVHFRAGVASDGSDTYLPRTVIYDFKAAFGTLRKVNELYDFVQSDQSTSNIWGGNTATQRLAPVEPSVYQQHLNQGLPPPKLQAADVRYWSDYSRVYYHPRSLVQVYETDLGPEQRSFDTWEAGEDLFKTLDNEHDLFDRDVRPAIEECDQMQGLQMLASVDGGWSGFAAKYMERFRDELGKTAVWVWALGEGQEPTASRRVSRPVNQARALYEMSSQASMYVPLLPKPLKLPSYASIDSTHYWCTSALQTTLLETVMLPTRVRRSHNTNFASLHDLAAVLSSAGERRIAESRFTVTGASVGTNGAQAISQVIHDCDLSPAGLSERLKTFAEIDIHRGREDDDEEMEMGNGHDEEIKHYQRFNCALAYPLLDSFPSIFKVEDAFKHATPVRAQLSSTSAIAAWVDNLESSSRLRVSFDEREALSNGLKEIGEAYKAGWSDDEDDWDA